MKHNITTGQLITIWAFGLVATFYLVITATETGNPLTGLFGVATPFFLVFYTLGWRAKRKNK